MVNCFQKVQEIVSMGRNRGFRILCCLISGYTIRIEYPFDEDISRHIIWSQYRPGINIFARLLVHHHNKKENAVNLKFVKVVDAWYTRCGTRAYHIKLEANDGEKVNIYKTDISLRRNCKDWSEMLNLGEVRLSQGEDFRFCRGIREEELRLIIQQWELSHILGGITEVEGSENNPKINSLARFAIEQHNKKENAILEFGKVVNAKEQPVSGRLYYITLEAKVGEKVNVYEAKIWERGWLNSTELTEFKLVGDDAPSVQL